MKLISLLSASGLLAIATPYGLAQIAAGIEGTVHDASGAAVARAQVVLTNLATGVAAQTEASPTGDFLFSHLNPGMYRLDVTAAGFEHLTRAGVTATVGQTVSADLVLTVGSEQEQVTVNVDAPLLQVAESDVETHIAGTAVIAVPLNSRNFINLTQLAPGVSLPPGTVLPRINGGRPAHQ